MHFNPQLFKVSIIQTKLFGPLDFELSRFHCTRSHLTYYDPVSTIRPCHDDDDDYDDDGGGDDDDDCLTP